MVERLVATRGRGSSPLPAPLKNDGYQKKNVFLRGNIPLFDKSEIHKYLKVDGWDVKSNDDKNF